MEITYVCSECKKEYKAGELHVKNGIRCECGGFIIDRQGLVRAVFDYGKSKRNCCGSCENFNDNGTCAIDAQKVDIYCGCEENYEDKLVE